LLRRLQQRVHGATAVGVDGDSVIFEDEPEKDQINDMCCPHPDLQFPERHQPSRRRLQRDPQQIRR
jgi:hypothetical protein